MTGTASASRTQREVALEQLVLQRLGPGGDDHLAAVEQRRDEVGEGLAGAGARFGDQPAALADRVRHRLRHRELLLAEAEAGQGTRERSAVAEDRGERRVDGGAAGRGRLGDDGGRSGQRGAFSRATRVAGLVLSRTVAIIVRSEPPRSSRAWTISPVRAL